MNSSNICEEILHIVVCMCIYWLPTFVHWLLFIYKILISSTCFEPQVLIFRRKQLYTCSIWYCHSLWEFLVACRYTAWVRTQAVYLQATTDSHREWQYHMLHAYSCILLKMSTWGSKHVEENNILWINNNQCIKLVINIESIHDARSEKYQVIEILVSVKSDYDTASFWRCRIAVWSSGMYSFQTVSASAWSSRL